MRLILRPVLCLCLEFVVFGNFGEMYKFATNGTATRNKHMTDIKPNNNLIVES